MIHRLDRKTQFCAAPHKYWVFRHFDKEKDMLFHQLLFCAANQSKREFPKN
jgi:hypothetical protein